MKNSIKIGLDFHGVITSNSRFFSKLSKILVDAGCEVHIISGSRYNDMIKELKEHNMSYTHIFSILDYHETIGTKVRNSGSGNPQIPSKLWDKTKADYCKRNGIDLHIDDSEVYGKHFKTPYALLTIGNGKKTKRK